MTAINNFIICDHKWIFTFNKLKREVLILVEKVFIPFLLTVTPFLKYIVLMSIFPLLLLKRISAGTSLVVQWLRLQAPNAGGPGSIPGQETRSHMP